MTTSNDAENESPRFPALWLLVALAGITGALVMREVSIHQDLPAAAYWTGVLAFGGLGGLGMALFSPRLARWTQARKASGKSTWWERLP